jgi:tetratricopeptide (TPR) repeat protein
MPMCNWLRANGMDEYCEVFERNKIENIGVAIDLSEMDLMDMGITFGDRKKIISFLDKQRTILRYDKTKNKTIANSINKFFIQLLIGGAIVLILALCFHVYIGNAGFKIFPKENLTLSRTIITQEYIDKIIDEYNNAGLTDKIKLGNDTFFQKLMNEGIIYQKDNESTEQKRDNAEQHYNNGAKYYEQKEYEKAVSEFSKAIELNPNYANAYTSRGYAYDKMGNYEKAIADYIQAIKIDSNYE